jgi:hypothetical protein
MTTVINLYGGPGAGKSTAAAFLYSQLKMRGANAELVREYVKNWVWDGRVPTQYDQMYFLGKQIRSETMLYGKVDYAVTDSPVLLNAYYSRLRCSIATADAMVSVVRAYYADAEAAGHRYVHVFLERENRYDPIGRFHTEAEARSIDRGVRELLGEMRIPYSTSGTSPGRLNNLLPRVLG